MSTTTIRDAALLVLVLHNTQQVIAERGINASGRRHDLNCGPGILPTVPGFHVWEGDIDFYSGNSGPGGNDPQDPDMSWQGEWRAATTKDLTDFGVVLPIE